ncbi:Histone-lysine N-methyltransferase ehmt1 [Nowakowskiella sp. JEL0407]|nr:Histone-lysine N-methyltransferase ehmt1 [Nowakowskiella sp. JEL0407]
MLSLPKELLIEVFKHLPASSVYSISIANRRLNSFLRDEQFRNSWLMLHFHELGSHLDSCIRLAELDVHILGWHIPKQEQLRFLDDVVKDPSKVSEKNVRLLFRMEESSSFLKFDKSRFPFAIMSEKFCCAFLKSCLVRSINEDRFRDLVTACVIVSIVNLWSLPLVFYLEHGDRLPTILIETSPDPREPNFGPLIALHAVKYDAVQFIQPLYKILPKDCLGNVELITFALWTAKHSPENITDIPRLNPRNIYICDEWFALLVTLFTAGRMDTVTKFLYSLTESYRKNDYLYRTLLSQLFTFAISHKKLALAKYLFGIYPEISTNHSGALCAATAEPFDAEICEFVYECVKSFEVEFRIGSAVEQAILVNNLDALKWLHSKSPNGLHERDPNGLLPLHFATTHLKLDIVEFILNDSVSDLYESELADDRGFTPAHIAGYHGSLDLLRMFIRVDPNVVNIRTTGPASPMRTPMDCACEGGSIEAVKYFLSMDAEFTSYALKFAIINNHIEIVKILLQSGADIDGTCDGWTPLHHAAHIGRIECVTLLLDFGTKAINAKTTEGGHTPLVLATSRYYEVMKLLLEKGAEIDMENDDGETPLLLASYNHDIDVLEVLLHYSADLHRVDKSGNNVFHRCCAHGTLKQLQLLIESAGERASQLLSAVNYKSETPHDICIRIYNYRVPEKELRQMEQLIVRKKFASH